MTKFGITSPRILLIALFEIGLVHKAACQPACDLSTFKFRESYSPAPANQVPWVNLAIARIGGAENNFVVYSTYTMTEMNDPVWGAIVQIDEDDVLGFRWPFLQQQASKLQIDLNNLGSANQSCENSFDGVSTGFVTLSPPVILIDAKATKRFCALPLKQDIGSMEIKDTWAIDISYGTQASTGTISVSIQPRLIHSDKHFTKNAVVTPLVGTFFGPFDILVAHFMSVPGNANLPGNMTLPPFLLNTNVPRINSKKFTYSPISWYVPTHEIDASPVAQDKLDVRRDYGLRMGRSIQLLKPAACGIVACLRRVGAIGVANGDCSGE